jgi:hypothetical protein
MKNLLYILTIFIINNSFGQYNQIVEKFYQRIDSTHKLMCCDSCSHSYAIVYEIPLHEYPVFDKVNIEEYENSVMNEGYIDVIVGDLVDVYKKIKPSIKSKFTKSCYIMSEDYKIHHDQDSDVYWVEGTLSLKIKFQANDKYEFMPWYQRIFK